MNFKWRQTKDRNIFLSSPLPKLFWHVVGRLHQVIGLLHAIPSLLAFFHMNLCCLVLRVDFISKISYFYISNHKSLLVFKGKYWKSRKNASILLPLNWNSSWLGWWILDFSKAVGQGGFGKYSNAKQVSQFMQTKFSCHKMSQNSTICPVS